MPTSDTSFTADGASVATVDDLAADRAPTDAERAYLDERATDTAEAIKKIKARIKGLEQVAKSDHEDAAAKAAALLPAVRESLEAAEIEAAEAKKARRAA